MSNRPSLTKTKLNSLHHLNNHLHFTAIYLIKKLSCLDVVVMCKSRKSTSTIPSTHRRKSSTSSSLTTSSYPSTTLTNHSSTSLSSSSLSTSLSLLKNSLSESPHIYPFSDLCKATNNFLSKPFSSNSWKCNLQGKQVLIFQRKLRRQFSSDQEFQDRLLSICRSHHSSLVKLLGASTSGNYIYPVYEYLHGGVDLDTCLRNKHNSNFTVLSSWLSRMRIATDVAHGLDYIHHCSGIDSGFVHNHIKSSSILVDDSISAKICYFGTSELCGEVGDNKSSKIEGTRGYMAPEFQNSGMITQKSDVYSFGVVILELISGEEALRYVVDSEVIGGYRRVSVVERAREALLSGGELNLRRWVDCRLKDSYPVEVVEKMVRLGLECVDDDPGKRPDMSLVAGRVSKLYLESSNWAEKFGLPTDFSVSMAPR